MLQQLKMDLSLSKKTFLYLLLASLAGFAFGAIMVFMIMTFDSNPGSWFCMGTLMSGVVTFAVLIFFHSFSYKADFMLALSMGRTRSCFMFSTLCILLLEMIMAYGLTLLYYTAEMTLYPILYAGFSNEMTFSFLTNWRLVLPALIIVPIVILFMGTMYAKFGKIAGIILYVVWMFGCLVLPRFVGVTERDTGLMNDIAYAIKSAFLAAPTAMLTGLGLAILAAMVVATWYWGKRQMVK